MFRAFNMILNIKNTRFILLRFLVFFEMKFTFIHFYANSTYMYHSAKVYLKQQSSQYPDGSKKVIDSQADLIVMRVMF